MAMSQFSRLLPGDPAPELRLSRGLVGDVLRPVVSDQLRLVVLWTAVAPAAFLLFAILRRSAPAMAFRAMGWPSW
ncbi:hypothetical protein ASG03_09340 [Rhizobium sp. Leaf341]|nr:hypothetical protein ASG03_09340 [Rhizobium sp. Leaf341]